MPKALKWGCGINDTNGISLATYQDLHLVVLNAGITKPLLSLNLSWPLRLPTPQRWGPTSFIKCLEKSILLFTPNRTSERLSYSFSLVRPYTLFWFLSESLWLKCAKATWWGSEFMGKTFQGAQLTHERFLTIDNSCKIFFDICRTEYPPTSGV